MTIANVDPRLLATLRAIRLRTFSYKRGVSIPPDILSSYSRDLGYPAAWGDPAQLPAYGGAKATKVWKALSVTGRDGLGGIPCELVHGRVTGGSCTANAGIRGAQAFAEGVLLYLPVRPFACLGWEPSVLTAVQGPLLAHPPHETSQAARGPAFGVHPALRRKECLLPLGIRFFHLVCRLPDTYASSGTSVPMDPTRLLGRSFWVYLCW